MSYSYDDSKLRDSINKVVELTGKDNETVLKETCLSIAKKAVQFTPPKNKKQGTDSVRRDFEKLYIDEDRLIVWSQAQGNNQVAKRITEVIQREDYDAAQAIFRNTPHLRNIEVTEFTPEIHESNRDSRGRVSLRKPRYLFTNPKAVKAEEKRAKQRVGYAKASFGTWVTYFGGSVPGWIGRYANSTVEDKSKKDTNPEVTMSSFVGFIASLDQRNNIIRRATSGAAKNMVTRARYQMRESVKKAGLD